jgi:hypothetical protein
MANQAIHGGVEILDNLSFTKDNASIPLNPKPRQISVINGQPCIYTDIGQGFYSWFPMGVKQSTYVHSQGVESLVWTINHGLDTNDYGVFVYDTDHSLALVNTEPVDSNTIRVELSEAMAGTAVVFGIPGSAAAGGIQLMGSVSDVVGLVDALAGKAAIAHEHTDLATAIDDIETALVGKASTTHTHGYATQADIDNTISTLIDSSPAALNTLNELAAALGDDPNFATTVTNAIADKASSVHTHTSGQVSGLAAVATSGSYNDLSSKPTIPTGTAATKDIPASGNASATQVVYGTDTRLTNARTPTTHAHAIADITALQTTLNAKVQADTNNTWTGVNTFGAAMQEKKVDLASGTEINLSLGNVFTRTISGATTFSVSNTPVSGIVASFILELTNGGANVNYWTGVKWAGGTKPALTAAGKDILGLFTHDGGTTWNGLVLGKDLK